MKPFILGITGGIGAGKTAATDHFVELGIEVVDADVVARAIVQPNQPALTQIIDCFGPQVLLPTGELNRSALRELIFSDEKAKQQLNQIMHPAIRNELLLQLNQAKSKYVILSAPLLFENNLQTYVDKVLVIDVPESLQIKRASKRDTVDTNQIQAIIDSQINRQQRRNNADFIIPNDGSLDDLKQKVETLHHELLHLTSIN